MALESNASTMGRLSVFNYDILEYKVRETAILIKQDDRGLTAGRSRYHHFLGLLAILLTSKKPFLAPTRGVQSMMAINTIFFSQRVFFRVNYATAGNI